MAVDIIARGMAASGGGGGEGAIDKVKINQVPLPIDGTDNSVNIPIGSATELGVVKSSSQEDEPNSIKIKADGTMEISNIELEKVDNLQKVLNTKVDKFTLQPLEPYLFKATYNSLAEDGYEWVMKNYHELPQSGGCSAIRKGNFFGRNYDWTYDQTVTFIIERKAEQGRYASVGMSGSIIQEETVIEGSYNELYQYMPFVMLDGINEKGVVCNVNLLPAIDRKSRTTGTLEGGEDVSMMCLIRKILDEAGSAKEAIYKIQNEWNIIAPNKGELDTEYHFMIADEDNSYAVEFIDNAVVVIEDFVEDKPIMTNFYLYDYDGTRESLTPHAMGIERQAILNSGYDAVENEQDMFDLLQQVKYTYAYSTEIEPTWYSEFSGVYEEYGDLTKDSTPEEYAPLLEYVRELFAHRQRDGKTWQTVHSNVYDIANRRMYLAVQENTTIEYDLEIGVKILTTEGTPIRSLKVVRIANTEIDIDPNSFDSSKTPTEILQDLTDGYILLVQKTYGSSGGQTGSSENGYKVVQIHGVEAPTSGANYYRIHTKEIINTEIDWDEDTVEHGLCLYLGHFDVGADSAHEKSNKIAEVLKALNYVDIEVPYINNSGQYATVGGNGTSMAIDTGAVFGEDNLSLAKDGFVGGGYQNVVAARNGFATGRYNHTYGERAFSANNNNLAIGEDSFVANLSNVGKGIRSATFGHHNENNGMASFITGHENKEYGAYNFISGDHNTIAKGLSSSVHGGDDGLISTKNMVGGYNNYLQGTQNSLVSGINNQVLQNTPTTLSSQLMLYGFNNTVRDSTSTIVGGFGNEVDTCTNSAVFGENIIANTCVAQLVCGRYNDNNEEARFIVGNGVDNTHRSNALVVDKNNLTTVQKLKVLEPTEIQNLSLSGAISSNLKVGTTTQTGVDSGQVVCGKYNAVSTDSLFLVGSGTAEADRYNGLEVKNNGSITGGKSCTSTGALSFVHGSGCSSTGWATTVEGNNNKSAVPSSHVEGVNNDTHHGSEGMHVQGRHAYIPADNNHNLAHVVGGGTWTGRKNIHTIDWDGNAFYAGSIEATSIILKSSTPNSTKRFKITIDDTGELSTTEIV